MWQSWENIQEGESGQLYWMLLLGQERWEMSKVESWKLEVVLQLNIYVFSLKEKNWKILTETCETQTFINFHYKFGDQIS